MNRHRGIVLAVLLLLVQGVSLQAQTKEEVQKQLVGRWEVKRKSGEREIRGEMTFTADGKASMKMPGRGGEVTFPGTWKVPKPSQLEITFVLMGDTSTETYELKLLGDALELTGANRKTQRWTRLK